MTKLTPDEEILFQEWYKEHARCIGINPNPDDPEHYYDYRGAYKAGMGPDSSNHWLSVFKLEGHPNMVVNGINTKTGERIGAYTNYKNIQNENPR